MEETPHIVTHFMAAGAEKRLEDYHFLRNTYETISSQEVQLNRILRMMGEDEISLNWRTDLLPIGRARNRFPYDFDRVGNTLVLQGSVAYERLRELDQDSSRNARASTPAVPSRRVQELRERRQNLSEQREYHSSSPSNAAPSAARLRALAEYDTALAESEAKRQRQAEENRSNARKNEETDVTERRREKFTTTFQDDLRKDAKAETQRAGEDSDSRARKTTSSDDNESENSSKKREKDSDRSRKNASLGQDGDDTDTIELTSFTVRCEPVSSSGRAKAGGDSAVRLLCQWKLPSSSSNIDYYTVERQSADQDWSPVGEKISKRQNEAQLDISLSNENEDNARAPSRFRLKAHLKNGQTSTSKPTAGIMLHAPKDVQEITPNVEVLSPNSVQLTWEDAAKGDEDEDRSPSAEAKTQMYDVEKKETPSQQKQKQKQKQEQGQEQGQNQGQNQGLEEEQEQEQGQGPKQKRGLEEGQGQNQDQDQEQGRGQEQGEEEEEEAPSEWEKVTEVPLSQGSVRIDSLTDASQCEFRLKPSSVAEPTKTEDEVEPEPIAVHDISQLLNSLHVDPTSASTVDVNIAPDGFKDFDSYLVEYASSDRPGQWKKMPKITRSRPHMTIDSLQEDSEYKFRFTAVPSAAVAATATKGANASQLSLVLDVKTPAKPKEKSEKDTEASAESTPPQFTIQKLDSTSVLIEAVVPNEEPAAFEDVFDVFSKNETAEEDWTKVGTIDKDHLSTTVDNLEENTAYAFKVDNTTSPSGDDQSSTIQEFKFDTTPGTTIDAQSICLSLGGSAVHLLEKRFDPSLLMEKIDQSLENVVNGVMQAAAGHQTLEGPVNLSLNEVIREVFRDEKLMPSEKFGFDTLALSNDLQIYRGPKQMMLQELQGDETVDVSKHHGEIIIHNYRTSQHDHPAVIVREENGNTRVANIDGDIIIRNVVSDVTLNNDNTSHQLGMNIVGQAFLKGVQGTLIASKFKGIIVVKNVHKP